jgi:GR25 family glycosyltransferase involved in LPS biosynthesis
VLRPPIFVISHTDAAARRARITRALNDALLPHTMVPAVDDRALPDGEEAVTLVRQRHLGRALSRGEIARLLSHLAVLDRVVRDGLAHACVLEDTVTIADDLPEILDVLLAGAGAWELVLLGHLSAHRPAVLGAETCTRHLPLNDRRTIARVAEFANGAHGYMVTGGAAGRLAAYARPVRMPIEWVIGHAPAARVGLFAVTPPCVSLEGAERHQVENNSLLARLTLAARKAGFRTDSYARRV